ncbi:MAG TPA: cyclic nucleotide-binding domain-containing protein, partial [Gammaproteobacteria bacterium]|nr:cyclic nucleotide-binding domain-containing protein [Gammaproteobacteria bacterium]
MCGFCQGVKGFGLLLDLLRQGLSDAKKYKTGSDHHKESSNDRDAASIHEGFVELAEVAAIDHAGFYEFEQAIIECGDRYSCHHQSRSDHEHAMQQISLYFFHSSILPATQVRQSIDVRYTNNPLVLIRIYPYMSIRESPMVSLLLTGHALALINSEECGMAMQLRKAAVDNVIIPIKAGVGYARPSLEVLSCSHCDIRGECLAEQLTIEHDHSYQLVKNKKTYAKGQHVFRGGDTAKAIYVVSSGAVKSYMLMENGEEQVLNFYLAGDVFGLDGMGDNCHIASTIAQESTTICQLPLSGLQDRALGRSFLNMISHNLLREHNLMLMLARKDADGRLASFIVDMS